MFDFSLLLFLCIETKTKRKEQQERKTNSKNENWAKHVAQNEGTKTKGSTNSCGDKILPENCLKSMGGSHLPRNRKGRWLLRRCEPVGSPILLSANKMGRHPRERLPLIFNRLHDWGTQPARTGNQVHNLQNKPLTIKLNKTRYRVKSRSPLYCQKDSFCFCKLRRRAGNGDSTSIHKGTPRISHYETCRTKR